MMVFCHDMTNSMRIRREFIVNFKGGGEVHLSALLFSSFIIILAFSDKLQAIETKDINNFFQVLIESYWFLVIYITNFIIINKYF